MVAVLSNTGIRLMPTSNYKARKLLASGRAVKERYSPVFTIRLLDRNEGTVQPIEYDSDTGAIHVGISIKSQKHEYVSEQRDLLADETERHDARRKYRRQRRNRLRYRKPRFENRRASKKEGWFPPSIQNRMNQQIRLFEQYAEVIPITQATFEMGSFDIQLLQAIESGKPAPKGTDYQQGPRYRTETLRQAVFLRDGYQCCFCGRGIKDHAKLHVHHLGFRKGDHTDRMSNLATACETCHTPKNHKPGGTMENVEHVKGIQSGCEVPYYLRSQDKTGPPEAACGEIPCKRCVCHRKLSSKAQSQDGIPAETPQEQPVPGKVL